MGTGTCWRGYREGDVDCMSDVGVGWNYVVGRSSLWTWMERWIGKMLEVEVCYRRVRVGAPDRLSGVDRSVELRE
jgi:hypothetical protein